LLRNDKIEAVILGITATPDFGIPIVAEALPGRGVIIDLGTRGDKNDQLTEIDHVVNIAANVIFYGGPAEGLPAPIFVTGGATASITVFGVVLLDPISSPSNPTLVAQTTYSVTDDQSWVDIETTVTNVSSVAAPVFSIADADILAGRSRIPFQPMEDRGHKPSLVDLSDPATGIGVWNYLSLPGNNGPSDGPANNDGSPSGKVTYTFVTDSVFAPFVGIADQNVAVIGNFFSLAAPEGIPPVTAAPANTLVFKRKLVVTNDNTVESGLDVALPLLYGPIFGQDLRATFNGKVVDGNGVGVPNVHVFADNTVPGAPDLSPLVSVLDENLDGKPDPPPDTWNPADGTDPLPVSHTVTAADGTFTFKLQALANPFVTASEYTLTFEGESRSTVSVDVSVNPGTIFGGPTALADVVLDNTGSIAFTVTDVGTGFPTAAKLTIVGTGGTPDPDFGNQFLTRRNFSLIEPNGPFPLTVSGSASLSNATAGTPALNFETDADGAGTLELPPGTYMVYASRGLEYTIDSQSITVGSGGTANVSLSIERVVDTSGYVSMDFHVHSGKSFDSSLPLLDRVASFLAEGVEVMVSTDHDYVSDFSPMISSLSAEDEINSIIGNELTGGIPVPADPTQDGTVFPEGIGHWNAWPLTVIENNRRNGAPPDEFITPGTAIDRLRGMDSLVFTGKTPDTAGVGEWLAAIQAGHPGTPGATLPPDDDVVMFNHPRAGFAGTVVIGMFNSLSNPGGNPMVGGYDSTETLSKFPNNGLFTPSLYNKAVVGPAGTDTNALSFDAIELMNGGDLGGYTTVHDDWCSLVKQGLHKTATAVSDSHRLVMENAGFGRSFVASSTDDPAAIDEDELTQNVKNMNLVGTSGPFIRFSVQADGGVKQQMGETAVSTKKKVVVRIRVEAAPWIPVEEVRIYRNCDLIQTHAVQSSKVLGKVLRFNRAVPIAGIDADSFITVEASVKIDGGGNPVTPGLLDTVQTIEPGVVPLGFTNPVFVDRDGNGYEPPGL
jgi:hypothetical protein